MAKDKSFRNIEIVQQTAFLPDGKIDAIADILDTDEKIKNYAYILHDKDKKEDGTLKPPHYHIMVRFNDSYKFSTIMGTFENLIPEQYFEKIKGRWGDALAYLTHSNAPEKYQYDPAAVVSNFEWEKEAAEAKKVKELEKIIDKIESGEIRTFNYTDYMTANFYAKFRRQIDTAFKFRNDKLKSVEVNRDMKCIYIVGGSGTGKTTYAKEYAKRMKYSVFVSSGSNDPFDGYAGQDCVILDDLRPSCMSLSDLLKILDNNTSSTVKSRYYNKFLECRVIIITTTMDIETFFKNVFQEEKETCKQFKRRCGTMIKFPKENDKTGNLEIYEYNDKTDKYDLVGYQKNPLPEIIKTEKEGKEKTRKMMSVLGEVIPPPPPTPEPELTEEERKALGLPF